jgi:uncharacterized protein with PQ loop repeat
MDQLLGHTATVLFSAMMLPQLAKSLRTRDARGVSVWPFYVGMVANVIAFAYASCIHQLPLQIKYTVAFCVLALCLYAYSRCEK